MIYQAIVLPCHHHVT